MKVEFLIFGKVTKYILVWLQHELLLFNLVSGPLKKSVLVYLKYMP